jgi:hypothetical protein
MNNIVRRGAARFFVGVALRLFGTLALYLGRQTYVLLQKIELE